MNQNSNYIINQSSESLRTLYRHRNNSNPMIGNRTRFTIALCLFLLFVLIPFSIQLGLNDFSTMQGSAILGHILVTQSIAICLILMFLLIDGSPESLGLGLVLSFASLADYFGAVGPFVESKVQIEATFECLSDVFKLYFAMQIARVSRKHILPWFILGVIISSIFGLLVSTVSSSEKELVAFLFTFKNTMVGLFAAWLCFRVGFAIIPEKIPWRVLALFLAAVGFIFEPFRTIFLIAIENNVDARHIANMSSLETFTNFVFLLAVFFNISTIENRIDAISSAKAEETIGKIQEEQKIHTAIAKTTQMLAHDIRKPFSLIKAYSDSLTFAKDQDEARQIISKMNIDIQKSLKMVDQLVTDIMDIGKSNQIKHTQVDVEYIIQQSLDRVFKLASKPNITFKYHFRHNGRILGDEQQLIRVFSNIIENAEQAIGDRNETITFSTFNDSSKKGQKISIEIHNTGTFIPKTDTKNLFDAFFTRGKRNGTGLGLAIVRKIILEHSGEVSVDSDERAGTSFRLILPANVTISNLSILLPRTSRDITLGLPVRAEESSSSESIKPIEPFLINETTDSQKLKITPISVLIIDDESAYANSVKSMLTQILPTGSTIFIPDWPDRLNLLEKKLSKLAVDVVICDYDLNLKSKNGLFFISLIKAKNPECLSILHTNRLLQEGVSTTGTSDFDFLLPKPLSVNSLADLLNAKFLPKDGKKCIIIIEDDFIFAENLARSLKGYETMLFESPDDFFKQSKNLVSRISLIITDLYFDVSEKDAFDVADYAKTIKRPVIRYSNSPSKESCFDGHLEKNLSNLTEILSTHLKKANQ